jgi:hypothetical protein
MDNNSWKFCRKSIMASSFKGKGSTPTNDHAKDISSTAEAAGNKPKAQVTPSRLAYIVYSLNEMIID